MQSLYLQRIQLESYRNFSAFDLKVNNNPIALIGKNGSGKTNILEAISLMFPGKGLRSAKLDEICKHGKNYWNVQSLINSKLGSSDISVQYTDSGKRLNLFNGSQIRNHELNKLVNILWLTPQMDNIFLGSVSDRRRFFDRIVYNFDLSHAKNLNKYEYYITERMKMLHNNSDASWIKVLEEKLAEVSKAIATSRTEAIIKMQRSIDDLETEFPKALLSMVGDVEVNILSNGNNVLEHIQSELLKNREKDKITGKTNFGVHRSDFLVTHKKYNKPAKFCSTGEQKSMLVSIILAQVYSLINEHKIKPIVLLDEVFVHLDNKRKEYLSKFITFSNIQTWITATDVNGIENFASSAEVVSI